MSEKAYITPAVLQWARESAQMTEVVAASKVSVTVEKLQLWESGAEYPTIHQAQTLAKAYRRPFALFFLPDVPNDFQPLQDFRKANSGELSTSSAFIIREIRQKQAWISDLNQENNRPEVPFIGRFTIQHDPDMVANDILKELGIHPLAYTTNNPILEWIDKAESKGIYISRTSNIHSRLKLDANELQGFAIADSNAPFVFVNSDDWNAPQLFTLVHELTHLWIAESGISNDTESSIYSTTERNPIELFCNEVTASALQREKEKKLRQKEKQGGPNYFLLQLNRNGRLFTQTVLDSFRGGAIEPTMASNLLNVQVTKFPKLEAQMYK